MATIEKRGSYQWRARVRRRGYPTVYKTFRMKTHAESWARRVESEMDLGTFVSREEAENTTLAEALDRYALEVTATKKGSRQELGRIKLLKAHPLSTRMLATLTGKDMAQYRDERLIGASPRTARLDLALISHLFTIAIKEWGMGGLSNPVRNMRLPTNPKGRQRRLQDGEEAVLLEACAKYADLKSVVVLALETAMRRGELMKIEWQHVDLNARTVLLPDTKSGESRTVPLSAHAVEALRSIPRRIDGRVFGTTANYVTTAFGRACKQANIQGLRFHDLRHEATSRFFERGLNLMQVAAITGHKTLEMLKRYTHLKAEDLAKLLG